jgi:hypothetical protein
MKSRQCLAACLGRILIFISFPDVINGEKKVRDIYRVCYHWYGRALKIMPLLSTETEENGHSSVNISNGSSVYDATKKVKLLPDSLLSFHTNSKNIVKFSVH